MLELPPDRVHVYFVRQDEIKDRELLDAYGNLLSIEEKRQKQRFYFSRDSHRYLVTRALIRIVLSEYSSIKPRDWRFKPNPHGRPEIINREPFSIPLSFNISHTRDMIMLGIARRSIGVDVENTRISRSFLEIADRYFSPREVDDINSLPKYERYDRFFYYWTLKEAYIKARGMGLSLPLRQFSFYFPGREDIKIDFEPGLNDRSGRWHFWLLKPTTDHIAAVGLDCPEKLTHQLQIKKIVPMDSVAPFSCTILRKTDVSS